MAQKHWLISRRGETHEFPDRAAAQAAATRFLDDELPGNPIVIYEAMQEVVIEKKPVVRDLPNQAGGNQ